LRKADQSLLYATDSSGNTPLVSAARGGHVDVLRMLMRDADKAKLDVARAVATAQQWQRTAALDVLGARSLGAAVGAAGVSGGGGGGGGATVASHTSPRNDMWSSSLADAPDVLSEDDAKSTRGDGGDCGGAAVAAGAAAVGAGAQALVATRHAVASATRRARRAAADRVARRGPVLLRLRRRRRRRCRPR
jgi:hypothetical protein